jgi:hypothetical protein
MRLKIFFSILLNFTWIPFASCVIPIIHICGDSHAVFCFSNLSTIVPADEFLSFSFQKDNRLFPVPFAIHWLGPKTMYSIGRDGLAVLNIKNFNVSEKEIVIFVFGEIDVRVHIGKQRDQYHKLLDEILLSLVKNYFNTIILNKSNYKNITCMVMSVLPPINQCYNPSFPFYGSLEDRIEITRNLNAKLKKMCHKTNIEFFDVYDLFATPEGALNVQLSDGCVHVNKHYNKLVKDRLIGQLLAKNVITLE